MYEQIINFTNLYIVLSFATITGFFMIYKMIPQFKEKAD